jgi:RNA polymerase sigma-70 factor (ECF subfamily)
MNDDSANSLPSHDSTGPDESPAATLMRLFAEHSDRLERMIEFRLDGRLRCRLDPADVLQDAFVEISRRYAEYQTQPQVSFYVWARQLTLQVLIDQQRKHFGQKRTPNQERKIEVASDGTSDSIAQFLRSQLTSPSGAAIRVEETQQLHSALASMDPIDREVLALRHFEHLGNTEVAEALGLSVTAASNRYVRAMERLGDILKQQTTEMQ